MQDVFPRVVVDELRKRADRYRQKTKVLLTALIKSECARAGISNVDVTDDLISRIEISPFGEIIGLAEVVASRQAK